MSRDFTVSIYKELIGSLIDAGFTEGLKIEDDKVYLKKVGNSIYGFPFHNPWDSLIHSTDLFTKDFLDERDQPDV